MPKPIDRFVGANSCAVIDALANQFVVHGNRDLATRLAAVASIEEHPPGKVLITQGAADRRIYLILYGQVRVLVNGQEIGRRHAGQHVGEMSLLDPSASRSATVIAFDTIVTASICERDYESIAEDYSALWRRIGMELGDRLRQRNRFVRQKNETPILFIGSSSESIPFVTEIVSGLDASRFIIRPWTLGVFRASHYPLEDLIAQLPAVDFAALVFGPDDELISRGVEYSATRDNVILELGLFVGAIGRERAFLVTPRDLPVKIPSDLIGVTPIHFAIGGPNDGQRMTDVCRTLSEAMANHGAR